MHVFFFFLLPIIGHLSTAPLAPILHDDWLDSMREGVKTAGCVGKGPPYLVVQGGDLAVQHRCFLDAGLTAKVATTGE